MKVLNFFKVFLFDVITLFKMHIGRVGCIKLAPFHKTKKDEERARRLKTEKKKDWN